MKKKLYEKPTTMVYKLKQQQPLLTGSATGDVNATMNDEWGEENI